MPPKTSTKSRPPKRLVAFENRDKVGGTEKWRAGEKDPGNFPAPFRMLAIGPPGVGKSTLAKNIIIHARPRYREVYVVHLDAGVTRDYEDLEPTAIMREVPTLEWINANLPEKDEETGRRIKRCFILDDLELTAACKERLKNLAVLFRYASSHKFCSIILCHQSFFDLPSVVKKMANVFAVYRPRGRNELALIENRVGIAKGDLAHLFDTVATGERDCLVVDHTLGTPWPLRLNIFEPIMFDDDDE